MSIDACEGSLKDKIAKILDGSRGIEVYSQDLGFGGDTDKFKAYLNGKRVVDMGSGVGRLAVEVLLEGLHTEVICVNPGLDQPTFRERQMTGLMLYLRGKYPEYQVRLVAERVNSQTKSSLAHEVDLPTRSYDAVFDNWAVSYYADYLPEDIYHASLSKMYEMLKSSGELLIGDRQSSHYGRIMGWSLLNNALSKLNWDFDYLYDHKDPEKVCGVKVIR